jgi:hypothetical protein
MCVIALFIIALPSCHVMDNPRENHQGRFWAVLFASAGKGDFPVVFFARIIVQSAYIGIWPCALPLYSAIMSLAIE